MHRDPAAEAPPVAEGRLWCSWVVASSVAWGLGGSMGMAIGSSAAVIVAICLGWCAAGMSQWVVLRREVGWANRWIAANLGPAVALLGLAIAFGIDGADVGAGVALAGAFIGIPHWLVLRRDFAWAGWWIVASAVGWAAGGFLSGAFSGGFAGWATIGAGYGAFTGVALVILLRMRAD